MVIPNIRRSELTTSNLVTHVVAAHSAPPEVYRLPKSGQRDPYHGLSRSWYYAAEKAGDLRLIRLRKRGNTRGVTLVPFAAVAELVRRAYEEIDGPVVPLPERQQGSGEFAKSPSGTAARREALGALESGDQPEPVGTPVTPGAAGPETNAPSDASR